MSNFEPYIEAMPHPKRKSPDQPLFDRIEVSELKERETTEGDQGDLSFTPRRMRLSEDHAVWLVYQGGWNIQWSGDDVIMTIHSRLRGGFLHEPTPSIRDEREEEMEVGDRKVGLLCGDEVLFRQRGESETKLAFKIRAMHEILAWNPKRKDD